VARHLLNHHGDLAAKSNLHRIRLEKGLTRREVAASAGITENSLLNYEKGKRSPRLTTAYRIAEALGVSVEEIA
jgi:putative transcriptional regulator